ncbi:MAG TPA: toll/interleukin-1 receptor domain-containing protein [Stellaceae bacterium]|nr:toll/interleukin-1 receptor domain-containing protein [Stellaceae bacterium]
MLEPFTVFVSHKDEDSEIAATVVAALKKLFEPHQIIDCFLSERMSHGQDWLEELHEQLHSAKYLLLIFTDPKEDWSWCMYEAGYFDALRYLKQKDQLKSSAYAHSRKIFCLHHADLPAPGPLAHLQATKATRERVKQFVITLIKESGADIKEEEQNSTIQEITSCFVQKDAVRLRTHSLTLVVKDKASINPSNDLIEAMPSECYFTGSDEALRAIFQRSADKNQLRWEDAVKTSRKAALLADSREQFDVKWLDELVDLMYNAREHYYPQRPIRGLVFTGANDIIYSPVIHEISEHRSGTLSCEIVFLKWEGNQYPKAPEHIRQLIIAVRMATRFRQEFLEEFKDFGEMARVEAMHGKWYFFRRRVWRAFYEVMSEGTSRGLSTATLSRAFNRRGRKILRDTTEEFSAAQREMAQILGGKEDLSSSLVQEKHRNFLEEDVKSLNTIYETFSNVNLKFLAMANIVLDAYFASTAKPNEWEAVKKSLSGVVGYSDAEELEPAAESGNVSIFPVSEMS